MDIDYSKSLFKCTALGTKDFDEFENKDSGSKDPYGDKLIAVVIDEVCALGN
tara:strand:+ start:1081 stop:1236 length:156 start_codon:yes stop_codon:yes gene_type:complete